ncbi:MAG: diguanylate cyclase [bacterium]
MGYNSVELKEQMAHQKNSKGGESLRGFKSLIERKKNIPKTNLSECLEGIVDETASLMGVERASVMLIDEKKEELSIGAARGLAPHIMKEVRIRVGEGIAGRVFKEDTPLWVEDISKDDRFRLSAPRKHYTSNSFLSAPLATTQTIGVINVTNKISGDSFTEADLDVLLQWSDQVAEVIEQARLYEKYTRLKQEAKELGELTQKLTASKTIISQVNDLLDRSLNELTLINEVNKAVNESLNLEDIIKSMVNIIRDVIDYHILAVFLVEKDGIELYLDYLAHSEDDLIDEDEIKSRIIKAFTSQTGESVERESIKTRLIRENQTSYQKDKLPGARLNSFLTVPFISSRVKGILGIGNRTANAFSGEDIKNLNTVAMHSVVAIENALLHKKVEKLSVTDELTDLYNYRHFQERLQEELVRAKRYQSAFSLIMLDIDDFKKVNDTYGHLMGDTVLKELARVIKGVTRGVNIVARYGGEEFVIILPEENKMGASVMAERLRKNVEEVEFLKASGVKNSIRTTISLGVSTYPEDGVNERDLIKKADEALYQAKKGGKNRVCWATDY